jgi:hypothetical protein
LYVNVNTETVGQTCAINIDVELRKFNKISLAGIGDTWANAQFCSVSTLGVGSGRANFISIEIKDMIDTCLSDVPPSVLQAVTD